MHIYSTQSLYSLTPAQQNVYLHGVCGKDETVWNSFKTQDLTVTV